MHGIYHITRQPRLSPSNGWALHCREWLAYPYLTAVYRQTRTIAREGKMPLQGISLWSASWQHSRSRRATRAEVDLPWGQARIRAGSWLRFGAVAVCILLAANSIACGGEGEPVVQPEAKAGSLEQPSQPLADENADVQDDIAVPGAQVDELDARLQEIEGAAASKAKPVSPGKEQWAQCKADRSSLPEGTVLERTARLAEDSGDEVHFIDHPGRRDRTVLVTPREFIDGETPLIVSLHGYGGDSADHASYVPFHQRVNTHGFALLLPNGALDAPGNPFWNPTDHCCDGGKTGEDDVAYLTDLVSEANKVKDFGPIYFFGYSNGGFMAHHMACKGLAGVRAVASLAGTSYVEDSSCAGAPPVSVLHVHGTADSVIQFAGDESEASTESGGQRAFYLGAWDMVVRWSQLAGCDWPEIPEPYATLDLDQYAACSETKAFRLESGCAENINIELWVGEGSGHAPGYGDAFVDALLGWLLSQ